MRFLIKSLLPMLLVLLVIPCASIFKPANAQPIPAPSVPDFSVAYINSSYYVPSTYNITTNPYTGQQVNTTQGGYYIDNSTINITIKNQPFTPVTIEGNTAQLFYEIRWKGHFENWTDHYINGINWYPDQPNFINNYQYGIQASNYSSTIVSWVPSSGSIPSGGKVDFEVKAQIGYTYLQYGNHAHLMPIGTTYQFVTESDWSNTRTLTLGYNVNSTSTSNPEQRTSPTPTIPELSWLAIVPLLGVLFSIAVVLRNRKNSDLSK